MSVLQIIQCCLGFYCAYRVYWRATRETRLRRYFLNRHVWVVGASQGLGRALCIRLHALGARITISSRSVSRLEKVSAECSNCAIVPLDISSGYESVRKALQEVSRQSRIDDVIANAGINHEGKHFTSLNPSEIDSVLDTNFRGVAHLFHAAVAEGMSAGTLCAVSSLAAYRGVAGASVYGGSKAALTTMCQALNVEFLSTRTGLRVVAVHPGFVDTPAIRGLDHPKPFLLTEEQAAEHVLDAMASGRRHSGFPWIMEHVVTRFSRGLPSPWYEYILHYTAS